MVEKRDNTISNVMNFSADKPQATLPPPLQAMWWLKKGNLSMGEEWQKAHEICQTQEGNPDYDIVHALAHWIEGDTSNAAYWYRRVGDARAASVGDEWERVMKLLVSKVAGR